jgi:hypothetical protein
MPEMLTTRKELREDAPGLESAEMDFETEGEVYHTAMFEYDEETDTMFLMDFVTGFSAFSEENALACAEMLDHAMSVLGAWGCPVAPEQYDLCVATHGASSNNHDGDLSRPSKSDRCELVVEEEARSGTRFVVRDRHGQIHQMLFRDGRLTDCDSGYSMLGADAIAATFEAIRHVQAELISRGERLDTMYEIELYNAAAVTEYRYR